MTKDFKFIEENLTFIIRELQLQCSGSETWLPDGMMSYAEQVAQIEGFACDAGEYGIAYESMVSLIEAVPVKLSGKAAIKLLEIGLLFGFKTELKEDGDFDRR
ncbi:hypothetical protein SAMN05216345_10635 [Cupriavidus sp. YR651]|uniref:hypothetical protein n=1 Tax=Cupriavidus sp. YR651 TaxID=1855315 RepID=UPI000886E0BD|nr:hypothetical protein [Cupriavidus sp. YR651]SDD11182.1 hypothetical protein SAMN05216345_10635 [Cupriavidus sp. YR651]